MHLEINLPLAYFSVAFLIIRICRAPVTQNLPLYLTRLLSVVDYDERQLFLSI